MKLVSRVCAEFKDRQGNVIYRIGPADRLRYITDAPDAIQEDLLFRMLKDDGSIEVIESAAQQKAVEQDPTAGTDATGKKTAKAKTEDKPAGTEKK